MSGDRLQLATGAVRGSEVAGQRGQFPARYDLISPVGLRRLAETYGEGALKYDDNNWLKGIPATNAICHAMAHIVEWLSGDTSEDHLAHAAWNLFTTMHFEERRPELIDVYFRNNPPVAASAPGPIPAVSIGQGATDAF